MKLGCSSYSFYKSFEAGKLNLVKWIEKCAKELKIDGVELLDIQFPSTDEKYLKKIKKLCIDLGLTIYCFSVSNHFSSLDEKDRKKNIQLVKTGVDIAQYLGAPLIRIFAGSAEELS